MFCSNCSAEITLNARFCHECGAPLDRHVDAAEAPPRCYEVAPTMAGRQTAKGRVTFHYGQADAVHTTAHVVQRYLGSKGLTTQIVSNGNETVVQGKRRANLIRLVLGLDQAVTVTISSDGDDLKTVVGGAKWID